MKTSFQSFFTILLVFTFSIQTNELLSQSQTFVKVDETFRLNNKFGAVDTIIIVFPDMKLDSVDMQLIKAVNIWGNKAVFKKESDLTQHDYKGHINYVGSLREFKTINFEDMPIQLEKDGFSYKGNKFNQPNDAFFFYNDNGTRLYRVGNTTSSIKQSGVHVLGAYQLYIFRDYEMYYTGFNSTTIDSTNNLEELRNSYFIKKYTEHFNVNISKKSNVDSIYNLISNELEYYLFDLARKLKTDTSNLSEVKIYIYSDMKDFQKFIGIPAFFRMYGLSAGNVIHTCNSDLGVLKHELTHNYIVQKIGENNQFFIEGFRQYTTYLFDSKYYQIDKEKTIKHLELLTYDLVKGKNFFSKPESYPISGIFVRYIIDKIGLDNFKRLYANNNFESDLKKEYNYSIEQLINEFMEMAIK